MESKKQRKIIKTCPYCKKIFETTKTNDRKYCSKECSIFARRTGHDIVCDNCGKIFYRRQYHIDRQKNKQQNNFCCMQCQSEYKHKHTYEFRICEICGEKFEVSISSNQRFCSTNCQNQWQTTRVQESNPQFASILTPCTYCGNMHYVKPYKFKEQEHFFCSAKCRQSWYAEVYSQTKEYREKSRKRMIELLQSGKFGVDTLPQQIANGILDSLSIKYQREHPFDYYVVDNYLFEYNLVIEVNGDYWHTNPQKFTANISQMQYERIGRDKAKHNYIQNQYDINILYLWESDIHNNILLCEELIKEYISNDGILKNYHSFNYSMVENNLLLNENIVIPYQDMSVEQYKEILTVAV